MNRGAAFLVGLAALVVPSAAAAAAVEDSPLSMGAMSAVFVPAKLATEYSVDVQDLSGKAPKLTWTLELKLVDAAGSSPAADAMAHAAVDGACDNSSLAGGKHVGTKHVWTNQATDFLWFHGDQHGCDHMKMGPSGHQGVVTVTAVSGGWTCTASAKGSNLSTTAVQGAAATCGKTGAVVPVALIKGLAQIDQKLDNLLVEAKAGKLTTKEFRNASNGLWAEVQRLIEERGLLGTFAGTDARAGLVFDLLHFADFYLDEVRGLVDEGGNSLQYVDNAFRKIRDLFDSIAAELKGSPGVADESAAFGDLGDEAKEAARQFTNGVLKPGAAKAKSKKLENEKLALIKRLPPIYGIGIGRLYRLYDRTLDALDLVSRALNQGDTAKAIRLLVDARTAKENLEAAFKKASGK